MSSDNGTYVLQTYGPEWRIARISAVENLYEEQDPETQKWSPNVAMITESYEKAKVFTDLEEAWDVALALEEKEPTEFGVNLIREFEAIKFASIVSTSKTSV